MEGEEVLLGAAPLEGIWAGGAKLLWCEDDGSDFTIVLTGRRILTMTDTPRLG
jgi:hypothetical protein